MHDVFFFALLQNDTNQIGTRFVNIFYFPKMNLEKERDREKFARIYRSPDSDRCFFSLKFDNPK